MNNLPNDPMMLMSFINMKLRDFYPDLDTLCEEGLITKEQLDSFDWGSDPGQVDYEKIYNARFPALRIAFENFKKQAADTFNANRDLVVGQMGSLQSELEKTKKLIIEAAKDETQCRKDCEKLESDLAWYESFQQELDGILK